MNIQIVRELKPYSYAELEQWIGKDRKLTDRIIKTLISMNIIKSLSSDSSKLELENLLDVETFEDIENSIDKNMFVFRYVGMLMVWNTCFFVYPKYINEPEKDVVDNYRKFKQILSVIRKFNSKEQIHVINGADDIHDFNLISFTLDFIQDYYENGLYSNDKTIIEENGSGEILWEKTLNEQNVYFSDDIPLYLDLYTIKDVINEEDLFRRLHRCILTESCNEISEILEILEIPEISLSSERIEDFGDREYLLYRIHRELTEQFITEKQQILYKMLSYITRSETHGSHGKISFVGTNSFNLIWEDVCAVVMDNCLNRTLRELGLKAYGEYMASDMLINIIPKPEWHHYESGKIHKAKKTLVPDMVSVNNGKLSIYDAKYYKINLDKNGVSNHPGVNDLIKQYLYEKAYKKLAEINNLVIDKNAFLIPVDSSEEKMIGNVSLELFSDYDAEKSFNDIEIILKPCEAMYKEYLNS